MTQQPLFSVIVPVYNAEATLDPCVASILGQLPPNGQLVLVNDGSTDKSPTLCENFAAQDLRVQVIHQPNKGASAARNAGLAAAKGQYLQFVDADDRLNPGLYTAALPALAAGADIFLFGVDSLSGLVNEQLPAGPVQNPAALRGNLAYYLVDTGLFACPVNKIYRASLVQGVWFDPALQINEDLLFNLQLLTRCGPMAFDATLYYVCDDRAEGSLSRRLRTDLLDAEAYTRSALLTFLAHCGLSASEANRVVTARQQHVAMAQCSVLLGRRGRIPFGLYRRLFAQALAPTHQRAAVAAWAKASYGPLARAVYLPCIRLKLAGVLAAWCKLRNRP